MAPVITMNGTNTKNDVRKPHVEPTPRWIRVEFNNELIGDTKNALLVRDGHRLTYYFPSQDINHDWLRSARIGSDGRQYFDLAVHDRSAKAAAWSYADSAESTSRLAEYIGFNWRKMDHWYEEEEEVFVHPRDPYHRVDTLRSSRRIKIVVDGVAVADSSRPVLLFETGLPTRYYLPQVDVRMDLLVPSRAKTYCPYKGTASYWNAVLDDTEHRNIVWGYLEPIGEVYKIEGLLSFFNEKADVFVDGQLEEKPESPWS